MGKETAEKENYLEGFCDRWMPIRRYRVQKTERSYAIECARMVQEVLGEWYGQVGYEAPNLEAIRVWFYRGCPDWAAAILSHWEKSEKQQQKLRASAWARERKTA